MGPVSYFLGMEITRDRKNKVIKLNQKKYTQNILQRFNKQNLNPVSTPGIIGLKLEKNTEQASPNDTKQYQQEVGSLIYLSTKTRPDIAQNVNTCARFMSNPNKIHYQALNQIWKYLNYTPTLGITYSGQSEPYILGYCDSDWGGDAIGRKSTSAYYFSFGRSPISLKRLEGIGNHCYLTIPIPSRINPNSVPSFYRNQGSPRVLGKLRGNQGP